MTIKWSLSKPMSLNLCIFQNNFQYYSWILSAFFSIKGVYCHNVSTLNALTKATRLSYPSHSFSHSLSLSFTRCTNKLLSFWHLGQTQSGSGVYVLKRDKNKWKSFGNEDWAWCARHTFIETMMMMTTVRVGWHHLSIYTNFVIGIIGTFLFFLFVYVCVWHQTNLTHYDF